MNTNSVEFFKSHKSDSLPDSFKLILAIWEPGNPENIGRLIRLGHNIGAEQVLLIQKTKNFRESKIRKTAGFSFDQMSWNFADKEELDNYVDLGYDLVALETCDDAKSIYTSEFPDKIILLAGSESHGIPENVISKAQKKVYIPMPGDCKSMNVSHALSVAAFEWYRQKMQRS